MKIDIHYFEKHSTSITPSYIGYIEMENFDVEKCFNICNWKHWTDSKPNELYAECSSCGSGICFTNPLTQEKWLAKSIGWLIGNSLDITDYVTKHSNDFIWI